VRFALKDFTDYNFLKILEVNIKKDKEKMKNYA